jgi:plastocyanin
MPFYGFASKQVCMEDVKSNNSRRENIMNNRNPHESTKSRMKWYALSMVAGLLVCPLKGAAQDQPHTPVQIVAVDECDPTTFNADPKHGGVGADFCRNVTLGAFTTLSDLFAKAAAGTPDPGWDFEPDTLRIKKGTPIVVVDQGGEPHTFTEVKHFGGGFLTGLNGGEETVSECSGGFKNLDVARTRILQGSQLQVSGLSKGDHYFQCCIHPWMRVKVEVHENGTPEK